MFAIWVFDIHLVKIADFVTGVGWGDGGWGFISDVQEGGRLVPGGGLYGEVQCVIDNGQISKR